MKAYEGILALLTAATWIVTVSAQECSASSPCNNGCCGPFGFCGYGPDFCGSGCQGTCDEVPECGPYAPPGREHCPLNVCCSEHHFCGTTEAFCGSGCQNGCDAPPPPSCGVNSGTSDLRTIGYYESWSTTRGGGRECSWQPEDVSVELLTHLFFSFALIGPDHRIATMGPNDVELYRRTADLKRRNPNLKVFIAVGGWAAGGPMFSNMAATQASRATFIESTIQFMETYGFDGVDLDWEYPTAPDRGGIPVDTANYVHLVREFRSAVATRFGLTVAIPAAYWYMQHFDLAGMATYVDWFNVMSYDIHGTWDGNSEWTEAIVQPHTNLTEIDEGLSLLWRVGVSPRQVVMGIGFYGRSFTLSDPTCTAPRCPFSGGANPGPCTRTSGVLSNAEIFDIIRENNLTPTTDPVAGVQYISWDGQWVSYDDEITIRMKKQFANNRCLAGTMIWAVDLDSTDSRTLHALAGQRSVGPGRPTMPGNVFREQQAQDKIQQQNRAALLLLLTECGATRCPPGFKMLTHNGGGWAFADNFYETCNRPGQPGYLRSRLLCIESQVDAEGCAWIGQPLRCSNGCPAGSIQLAANTAPKLQGFQGFITDDTPRFCGPGRYASYCCNRVTTQARLERCDMTTGGSSIIGGGLGAVGPAAVVRKSQRAAEIMRSIEGLRLPLGLDPIGIPSGPPDVDLGGSGAGGSPDPWASGGPGAIYGDGAWGQYLTPQACDFSRNQFLGGTGSGAISAQIPSWWDVVMGGTAELRYPPDQSVPDDECRVTRTYSRHWTEFSTRTKGCDVDAIPQACLHYRSAANNLWVRGLNDAPGPWELLCPFTAPSGGRTITGEWNRQHALAWREWVPTAAIRMGCQRDEYPFFRFMGLPNNDKQYLRYNAGWQNNQGGRIPFGVCPPVMEHDETTDPPDETLYNTCWVTERTTWTQIVLSIRWDNWDDAYANQYDYRLYDNECTPIMIIEPGFALLTDDPWYSTGGGAPGPPWNYAGPVPAQLTQGWIRPRAMAGGEEGGGEFLGDPEFVVVEERNKSRRATPEDLYDKFGLRKCKEPGCREELAALGLRLSTGPGSMGSTEAVVTPSGDDTGPTAFAVEAAAAGGSPGPGSPAAETKDAPN